MKFTAFRTVLQYHIDNDRGATIKLNKKETVELRDVLTLSHRQSFSRWMARELLRSGIKEMEKLKTKSEKHKKMVELLNNLKQELGA